MRYKIIFFNCLIRNISTLLIILFVLCLLIQVAHTQEYYDDFNDNSINLSLWTIETEGSGPAIAETNQRLEITFPSDSADNPETSLFWAGYSSTCQLRDDFDIQVDYELINWPSGNGVRIGLHAAGQGPVERTSFGANIDFPEWPREIYLTHFTDDVQGITSTNHFSGKLRLVRLGTTLSGYYFNSGDWILIHTGPTTTDDVHFSLSSWSHDYAFTDQSVKIAFDNIIVNEGHLIYPKSIECTEDDSGTLDIEGIYGKKGQEVLIPIRLQSTPKEINSFGFEVTYDANILEYIDIERGDLVESFETVEAYPIDASKLRIGGYTDEFNISQGSSGYLVLLKFRVINGEDNNCYPLYLDNLVDHVANFSKTGGCFCVWECNGDLNEDGQITPMDALIVFRCYLGSGDCSNYCDVDGNGLVTPLDALCIFQKFLGKPSCLD